MAAAGTPGGFFVRRRRLLLHVTDQHFVAQTFIPPPGKSPTFGRPRRDWIVQVWPAQPTAAWPPQKELLRRTSFSVRRSLHSDTPVHQRVRRRACQSPRRFALFSIRAATRVRSSHRGAISASLYGRAVTSRDLDFPSSRPSASAADPEAAGLVQWPTRPVGSGVSRIWLRSQIGPHLSSATGRGKCRCWQAALPSADADAEERGGLVCADEVELHRLGRIRLCHGRRG